MSRDRLSHNKLLAADWRVAVVWECAMKGRGRQVFDALIDNLLDWIHDPRSLGIELAGDAG